MLEEAQGEEFDAVESVVAWGTDAAGRLRQVLGELLKVDLDAATGNGRNG